MEPHDPTSGAAPLAVVNHLLAQCLGHVQPIALAWTRSQAVLLAALALSQTGLSGCLLCWIRHTVGDAACGLALTHSSSSWGQGSMIPLFYIEFS